MTKSMKIENYSMRNIMNTISSIIGENGLNSVLNYSKLSSYVNNLPPPNEKLEVPVEDYLKVKKGLKEVFGVNGSNVLLRNTGKEFIRISIERVPEIDKLAKSTIAHMPDIKKVNFCIKTFTDLIIQRMKTSMGNERYKVEEKDGKVILTDRDNPMMVKNSGDKSDGYFVIGMLQCVIERYVGKEYDIKQTKSVAHGDEVDEYTISYPKII